MRGFERVRSDLAAKLVLELAALEAVAGLPASLH